MGFLIYPFYFDCFFNIKTQIRGHNELFLITELLFS